MREGIITELARKYLDTTVTVYFANEYIKGWWFSIDAHTNVIGVQRIVRKGKRNVYIDIDTIVAIEVTEDE